MLMRNALRNVNKGVLKSHANNSKATTTIIIAQQKHDFSTLKKHTTIVGLAVDHNAREKLIALYKDTLEEASSLSGQLKQNVEQVTKFRLRLMEDNTKSVTDIEKEIDCGQIEEILDQAKDELQLIRNLQKL